MLSLGFISISDFLVANLFIRTLPGLILIYLATPFYTEDVVAQDMAILTYFTSMHAILIELLNM